MDLLCVSGPNTFLNPYFLSIATITSLTLWLLRNAQLQHAMWGPKDSIGSLWCWAKIAQPRSGVFTVFCIQLFPCHFFTLKCTSSLKCYISPNSWWILLNLETVHSPICNLDVWYIILPNIILFKFMLLDSWGDFCESNSSSKWRTPKNTLIVCMYQPQHYH